MKGGKRRGLLSSIVPVVMLVVAGGGYSLSAFAAEKWSRTVTGPYFGAEAGGALYTLTDASEAFFKEKGWDDDAKGLIVGALTGYRITPHFGLELGYRYHGKAAVDGRPAQGYIVDGGDRVHYQNATEVSQKGWSLALAAVGYVPFDARTEGYVKAGFYRWDIETSLQGDAQRVDARDRPVEGDWTTNPSADDDGFEPTLGLGLDWAFDRHVRLGVGYDWMKDFADEDDAHVLTARVKYYFH